MYGRLNLAKTLVELNDHGLSCRNVALEFFLAHDDIPGKAERPISGGGTDDFLAILNMPVVSS